MTETRHSIACKQLKDIITRDESVENFIRTFKGDKLALLMFIEGYEPLSSDSSIYNCCVWLTNDTFDVFIVLSYLLMKHAPDSKVIDQYTSDVWHETSPNSADKVSEIIGIILD